jgi:hypothetical protein
MRMSRKPRNHLIRTVLVCGIATAGFASAVRAAQVNLSGTGGMTYSYEYVGPNSTTPTSGNTYSLAVPGQYTFTNSFTSQQTQTLGTSSAGAYDFQDSYEFTVGASASGDTLVAQLGLPPTFDISNLQLRLYEVPSASTVPTVGPLPSGDTSVTSWMGIPTGQNSIDASFSNIQGGETYVLDVAGIASGSSGGTYFGQLNLAPVPLPAAALLLLSGVGGLGAFARSRKSG